MKTYKIFLRNDSGELVGTEQIQAETIQNAIVQVNDNYDVIGKGKEEEQ